MNHNDPSQTELRRLILLIFRRRRWIAMVSFASIVVAITLAVLTPSVYRAQTVLLPADSDEGMTAASSLAGQLGGIAALAGLGGHTNKSVVEAMAILKSRQFTQDFIRERNLMPQLFHNRWDSDAARWKPGRDPPTMWDAYKFFDRKVRHVEEDRKTGIVTLQIDWQDPVEAAKWANELVNRVNGQMKAQALSEATKTIDYLTRERQKTDVTSVEQAIDKLIEVNMKKRALASVRDEYALRVVDPAAPPDRKDKLKPYRTIYVITGAVFGLLLSFLVIISYEFITNVKVWVKES